MAPVMSDYDKNILAGLQPGDPRQSALLVALEALPEDQREALRLRYLIGLPSKEVARKLGKGNGATRVLISRALRRLQELLPE